MSEVRTCFKCGIEKPLNTEHFYLHTTGKLMGYCKECRKADSIKWARNNKPKRQAIEFAWRQNNQVRNWLLTVKGRAKKAGIPFDDDISDIVVPEYCPILGIPLRRNVGQLSGGPNSPSLDKIIPPLGYIKGNRWVISHRANTIKSNATFEELVVIGKWAECQLKGSEYVESVPACGC